MVAALHWEKLWLLDPRVHRQAKLEWQSRDPRPNARSGQRQADLPAVAPLLSDHQCWTGEARILLAGLRTGTSAQQGRLTFRHMAHQDTGLEGLPSSVIQQ